MAVTTKAVGLAALALPLVLIDAGGVSDVSCYDGPRVDVMAFRRARTTHNFSYLGGFAGIVTGCLALWRQRQRLNSDGTMGSTPTRMSE